MGPTLYVVHRRALHVVHGPTIHVVYRTTVYVFYVATLYVVHGPTLYVVHGLTIHVVHGSKIYVVHGPTIRPWTYNSRSTGAYNVLIQHCLKVICSNPIMVIIFLGNYSSGKNLERRTACFIN